MRFAALILLAAALGVSCAVLVACGGNDSKLIPERDAAALKRYVDRVGQAVAGENCEAAVADVQRAQARIANLPDEVDPELRENLQSGFNNLLAQAQRECQPTTQTTTTETTTTETTETTDTETTDTETTDTQPTEPTDTQPTDTEPTPPDEGGSDSGGDPAPGDQGSGGSQFEERGSGRVFAGGEDRAR